MDPVPPKFTANVVSESTASLFGNYGWKKILVTGILLFLALIIWTYVDSPMVVTVTGSGEVSAPATNATLSFTLSSKNDSIESAISSVSEKADSMRNYLTGKGFAEGDIAQSQITAVPSSLVSSGSSGYQATVSMAAKTTRVSNIASFISDLYINGAVVVTQPILSIDNQSKLDEEAFNSALKDARSKAFKIGLSSWKLIKKVVSIGQASSPTTSTATTKADAITSSDNTTAATNGVFKVVKAVSVTYKMW